MRAVNLVPADAKPSAAGRSGGGVYVLLAGLALLVVIVGAMVSGSNAIKDREAELARVEAQVAVAEAKAASLAPYTRFTQLREARVQTVSSLVASRFDWSTVFHEIARVIPKDAWLTGMKGSLGGDAGQAAAADPSTPKAPKIDITGCTTGHKSVARMMVALRIMDGVDQVTLTSSSRGAGDSATPASGAPSSGSGCSGGAKRAASFAVTVAFKAVGPAATAAPGTAPAPGTPAAGATTQPASTPVGK